MKNIDMGDMGDNHPYFNYVSKEAIQAKCGENLLVIDENYDWALNTENADLETLVVLLMAIIKSVMDILEEEEGPSNLIDQFSKANNIPILKEEKEEKDKEIGGLDFWMFNKS